ncbi:hypothetical protein GTO89_03850 [Heliobacterium gestii]|uniref:GDYXXLXY domain-containing protein n=1 Tax=Heliomicrobium gestii TaxID=2699 RepID=A0A845L9A9_HELGE|nr:GDYXXLXY domain-containing protein [Heliomicrobium gestii]MBM7865931.1 putative membrane-anchored protein [Heliomicrobium gestii]MZP42171.1 hypothetical protein [Heliomicrobium gestii]
MRRKVFIAVVALQVLVLLLLAGSRALIVSAGQEILLKASPVDPRHPFMGDYVQLRYNISEIDTRVVPNDITEEDIRRHNKVFVILEEQQGLYQATGIYQTTPVAKPGQVVLTGRFQGLGFPSPLDDGSGKVTAVERGVERTPYIARVDYGLERYYLSEGKGAAIELALREQKNVYAHIRVWRGDSVLTDLFQDQ